MSCKTDNTIKSFTSYCQIILDSHTLVKSHDNYTEWMSPQTLVSHDARKIQVFEKLLGYITKIVGSNNIIHWRGKVNVHWNWEKWEASLGSNSPQVTVILGTRYNYCYASFMNNIIIRWKHDGFNFIRFIHVDDVPIGVILLGKSALLLRRLKHDEDQLIFHEHLDRSVQLWNLKHMWTLHRGGFCSRECTRGTCWGTCNCYLLSSIELVDQLSPSLGFYNRTTFADRRFIREILLVKVVVLNICISEMILKLWNDFKSVFIINCEVPRLLVLLYSVLSIKDDEILIHDEVILGTNIVTYFIHGTHELQLTPSRDFPNGSIIFGEN